MKKIDELLSDLGNPYDIQNFDGEDCIHRIVGKYEFEVSGTHTNYCTLYVWISSPREVIAIYNNIPTENLKDVLGYYATVYQNLLEQIRVEREETRL